MKYTKFQSKYIETVDGNAHLSAVEIIGELEKGLRAKEELLVCYRIGKQPSERLFSALEKFNKEL